MQRNEDSHIEELSDVTKRIVTANISEGKKKKAIGDLLDAYQEHKKETGSALNSDNYERLMKDRLRYQVKRVVEKEPEFEQYLRPYIKGDNDYRI